MRVHEFYSRESEWYTPPHVFNALDCRFDTDVAAAPDPSMTYVPAESYISRESLEIEWKGFVWCNPPWAGRGQKQPWINKMHVHGNGILLTPDRTSAPWWQDAAAKADIGLFVAGKIKFIPGPFNTSNFKQPGNGTCLFGWGEAAVNALRKGQLNGLGTLMRRA